MPLSFIQALRRRLNPRPVMSEPEIRIHEDDWAMRRLHPMAVWDQVQADMAAAEAASEANFDGIGWTEMHAIQEPDRSFADDGVTVAEIDALLAPLMPRVKRFRAGIPGSWETGVADPLASDETEAWCYGFDRNCFVKIEPKEDLVREIWFEAATRNPEHLALLRQALIAIDSATPCCIADYWAEACGAVGDREFLDLYLDYLARGDEPV